MYTITYPGGVLRLNGAVVEQDDRRPEYRAYVQWLSAGNGPVELQGEPPPPRIEVSAWQIRKALNATGLRDAVEIAVANSGNIELADGWNYAPAFFSDNALTLAMGAGLGKTREEMYGLFKLASEL